ncbi:hypothetical protein HU200_009190 [Digitaria exilis]|uniref:Signal recognition particle receptor alpha subunit N-terminal domain-containing protein n=1 Tax=Digitaria exilis TaxID=1010633 RepID=A0A835FLA9_9POAL|nr:hypothetical protein HU200_009190 [Digitaria exilis]CAB3460168.1 unnamed protein product [Digitaria exilis]
MLEELLIFTRGGLILWALSGGGAQASPVDALIRSGLLEERPADGAGVSLDGKRALKWAFDNGLGLVFVAVYRRVLRLLYVDDLLAAVRAEFARVYNPKRTSYDGFGDVFRQLHLEAQARADEMNKFKQAPIKSRPPSPVPVPPSHNDVPKVPGDDGGNDGGSKQGGDSDGESGKEENSGDPEPKDGGAFNLGILHRLRIKVIPRKDINNVNGNKNNNKGRKKNKEKEGTHRKLDFSDPVDGGKVTDHVVVKKGVEGQSEMDTDENVGDGPKAKGWFSSVFQSIAGGNTVIGKSDLQPALKALKDRLMTKNVAEEIAEKLCESVAAP